MAPVVDYTASTSVAKKPLFFKPNPSPKNSVHGRAVFKWLLVKKWSKFKKMDFSRS